MLIEDFYTVIGREQPSDGTYLFRFRLNPGADVYRGHFPSNPIAPGVCTIQMIKECLQTVLVQDNVHFTTIKQCRFTGLLQPSERELQLSVSFLDDRWISAEIRDDERICMKIKAQYS